MLKSALLIAFSFMLAACGSSSGGTGSGGSPRLIPAPKGTEQMVEVADFDPKNIYTEGCLKVGEPTSEIKFSERLVAGSFLELEMIRDERAPGMPANSLFANLRKTVAKQATASDLFETFLIRSATPNSGIPVGTLQSHMWIESGKVRQEISPPITGNFGELLCGITATAMDIKYFDGPILLDPAKI